MSPYEKGLGERYLQLAPCLQVAHSAPLRAAGEMCIEWGRNPFARFIARASGLPAANPKQAVTISVDEVGEHILWARRFGDQLFETKQWFESGLLLERRGPTTFAFDLDCSKDQIVYKQRFMRFLGIRYPRFLATRIDAVVKAAGDGWEVSVAISMPLVGLLCRYSGEMRVQ